MRAVDECKTPLRAAGAVPSVVGLLTHKDAEVQKYAVRAVAYLALDKDCRDEMEKCVCVVGSLFAFLWLVVIVRCVGW